MPILHSAAAAASEPACVARRAAQLPRPPPPPLPLVPAGPAPCWASPAGSPNLVQGPAEPPAQRPQGAVPPPVLYRPLYRTAHLSPRMSASSMECVVSTIARSRLARSTRSHRCRLRGGKRQAVDGRQQVAGGRRRRSTQVAQCLGEVRRQGGEQAERAMHGAAALSRPGWACSVTGSTSGTNSCCSPADGVQPGGGLIQVDHLCKGQPASSKPAGVSHSGKAVGSRAASSRPPRME